MRLSDVKPIYWWLLGGVGLYWFLRENEPGTVIFGQEVVLPPEGDASSDFLTIDLLLKAMPGLPRARAEKYYPHLIYAMKWADINTIPRIAAFLAQTGFESNDFSAMQENLNYSAEGLLEVFPKYFNLVTAPLYARQPQKIANYVYADRLGNGPEASGDGWRFRGRGPIQLTGRYNYKQFSDFVNQPGVDLTKNPEYLEDPAWGFLASAYYWVSRNLNALADKNDFRELTYRINTARLGYDKRLERFETAKAALTAAQGMV